MSDSFPCPKNPPKGEGLSGTIRYGIKLFADLQNAALYPRIKQWLEQRQPGEALLEVGCGEQPFRHLVPKACHYQGLDWEQSNIFGYDQDEVTRYDGTTFPFESNTFDALFHTSVMEHVYEKEAFLAECVRVLKPGGKLFISVPFQARYHYIPIDYWRYTPAALQKMYADAGLTDVQIEARGRDIAVAGYKVVSVFYRWLLYSGVKGKIAALIAAFPAGCGLLAAHLSLLFDWGSEDDCLCYVSTATKPK